MFDEPAAPPVTFRKFDDIPGQRQDIYDYAAKAITNFKPIENATHRLEFSNVGYDNEYEPGIADEKDAVLRRRTLQRALKADVALKDTTGRVVDQQRMTVAHVPHLNSQGLFVRNGVQYALRNQLRLRPGIYTREQRNGGVETHFNAKPGTGRGFRIELEPQSGLFKFKVDQSTTRLYPVLKSLGVSDEAMKAAWGNELFEKNFREPSGRDDMDMTKLVHKLSHVKGEVAHGDLAEVLKAALQRSQVDEDTTELTLGERVKNITPDTLLKATQKQLKVARKEVPGDNRDSQAFQSFHNPQSLIAERLGRDITGSLRQAFWRASRKGSLQPIQPGMLNKNIGTIFEGSGLAQTPENINPMEIHDLRQAITRLGEGGIRGIESVSKDARNVQASYLGVIDANRAPESGNIGVDLRATDSALQGSDNQLYTTVRNLKTGQLETVSARNLATKTVAFPGEMGGPNKRVAVVRNDKVTHAPKDEIDYEIVSPDDLMSRGTRIIPFPEGIKGQRLLMGARMTQQAVPLKESEAPFVQSADHDGSSLHRNMGESMGARYAPEEGVVIKVEPDSITLSTSQGKKKIDLYNNYYLGRKTALHNTPVVEVGTPVRKGEILAKSNFTDKNGTFSIGRNLRSAYMSDHGNTIEDAFVISESAARKLGSEAMYKTEMGNSGLKSTDKGDYTAVYSDKYKPDQLDKIGDDGVIKVGATVNTGDPLILGIADKPPSAIGALMTSPKSSVSDKSQIWDHHAPGVVTDVERTKDGIKVLVKSYDVANLGDKLAPRYGNKGVIAKVRPDAEMPIASDGKPLEVIFNTNGVISRCYDEMTELLTERGWFKMKDIATTDKILSYDTTTDTCRFCDQLSPMYIQDYSGEMMGYRSNTLDFLVTPDHKFWAMDENNGKWHEKKARDIYGKRYGLPYLGMFEDNTRNMDYVEFPALRVNNREIKPTRKFGIEDFCELLGWYLSEGHLAKKECKTFISQSNSANPQKVEYIGVLLSRMGLSAHYKTSTHGWVIYDKQLTEWLALNCGERKSKRIPRNILTKAPVDALSRLFTGLWMGDGHVAEVKDQIASRIKLTALGLIDDIQEMLVYMGMASRITDVTAQEQRKNPNNAPSHLLGVHLHRVPRMMRGGWFKEQYNGKVYCPTVETGYVITRRNGTLVVAGNTNPSTLAEQLLGKIVERTGREPYAVKAFDTPGGIADFALNEAQKAGIPETETVVDPRDGRSIPGVYVGNSYIMRLHHKAEGKLSARDQASYTTSGYPAKGGPEGAKKINLMDSGVLLAAGATNFLKDVKLIRGQRNDDYWRQVRHGETPIAPTKSFADDEFKDMLKGAGVHIKEDGTKEQLRPLLDKDIDAFAKHEIQNGETYNFDTMDPVKGGLFDIGMTGGAEGKDWAKITLPEKIPHPLFIEPIQKILGLTGKGMNDVLSGKEELYGKRGPEAIEKALQGVDIDKAMEIAKNDIRGGRTSKRDDAVKRLQYLQGLKTLGVKPEELMVSKVAVVPPRYRPVVRGESTDMIHDLNYLYHDLLEAKKNYHDAKSEFGSAGDQYLTLMNAVKAISGKESPVNPKTAEQGVKGILNYAIGLGSSPKYSTYHRRVIGSSVDTVGRTAITANGDLGIDEIGLPEKMAWSMFRPFVIRRMVQNGMPPAEAMTDIQQQTPVAKAALEEEMKHRPIVYNRAPALHRYAYQGAFAKLVPGDALHVPYHTLKATGADFDGDAENVHVPVSEDAIEDVKEKLMPSKNLHFTGNFETHYEPTQDYTAGLYLAGKKDDRQKPKVFLTAEDAKSAYARGEIGAQTPIRILHRD